MRIVYFLSFAAAGASYVAVKQEIEAIRSSVMVSTLPQRSTAVQAPNRWYGNTRSDLADPAFNGSRIPQNQETFFDQVRMLWCLFSSLFRLTR
jgi:hypothetical protein